MQQRRIRPGMAKYKDPNKRAVANGWKSGLEEKLEANLDNRGIGFLFEDAVLQYTVPERTAKYTADFFLRRDRQPVQPVPEGWYLSQEWWNEHFVVETKGVFETADRQKQLLIKKQYPMSDIRLVFDRYIRKDGTLGKGGSLSPLYKGSKSTYASWCEKHGFIYADNEVPDEWFN